jgi:hypothetical protein
MDGVPIARGWPKPSRSNLQVRPASAFRRNFNRAFVTCLRYQFRKSDRICWSYCLRQLGGWLCFALTYAAALGVIRRGRVALGCCASRLDASLQRLFSAPFRSERHVATCLRAVWAFIACLRYPLRMSGIASSERRNDWLWRRQTGRWLCFAASIFIGSGTGHV